MSVYKFSDIFEVGISILKVVRDSVTNTLMAQTGSVTEETVSGDSAEIWQHVGFASMMANPVAKTSAAEAICIRGARDHIIATRDVRGQAIYGSLKEGETCVYAGGPNGTAQGRILLKQDGSVSLITKQGNTDAGAGVLSQVSADGSIKLMGPFGGIVIDATGITLTAGSSSIVLGASGTVKIVGNQINVAGGTVVLGYVPVVLPIMSAIYGVTGISGAASTKVFIAP